MNRIEAYQILTTYVKNANLIKHSLATEAAMRGICKFLLKTPDEQTLAKWEITGLLHDADYEMAYQHPEMHGIILTQKINLPEDVAYAIRAHNYQNTRILPQSQMDWAIASCDQLTGLIIACALVHPGKRIEALTEEFVLKKFYDKSFAKSAERSSIIACEEKLEIPLIKLITIVLASMKEIAGSLGL